MDTPQDHVRKATQNLAFADSIDLTSDTYADWAIVVLFYSALHYVRAALHVQGKDHGTNHARTLAAVDEVYSDSGAISYGRLYSRSRLYRYDVLTATVNDFTHLRHSDFDPLLSETRSLIGL